MLYTFTDPLTRLDSHSTYNSTRPFHSSNKGASTKLSRGCRLPLPLNRQENSRCAPFHPILIEITMNITDCGRPWSVDKRDQPSLRLDTRQQVWWPGVVATSANCQLSHISFTSSSSNFTKSSYLFIVSLSLVVSTLSRCLMSP